MEIKVTINKIYILLESVKGLQNQFAAEIFCWKEIKASDRKKGEVGIFFLHINKKRFKILIGV